MCTNYEHAINIIPCHVLVFWDGWVDGSHAPFDLSAKPERRKIVSEKFFDLLFHEIPNVYLTFTNLLKRTAGRTAGQTPRVRSVAGPNQNIKSKKREAR